jgi:hypothetical protein
MGCGPSQFSALPQQQENRDFPSAHAIGIANKILKIFIMI